MIFLPHYMWAENKNNQIHLSAQDRRLQKSCQDLRWKSPRSDMTAIPTQLTSFVQKPAFHFFGAMSYAWEDVAPCWVFHCGNSAGGKAVVNYDNPKWVHILTVNSTIIKKRFFCFKENKFICWMLQTKQRTTYRKQIQHKRLTESKARLMDQSKQSNRKWDF